MVSGNPLQIAVLNLFIAFRARFPNLIVGILTRESVKKALTNGITADQVNLSLEIQAMTDKVQILSYLVTHSHPQMRKHVCRELRREGLHLILNRTPSYQ